MKASALWEILGPGSEEVLSIGGMVAVEENKAVERIHLALGQRLPEIGAVSERLGPGGKVAFKKSADKECAVAFLTVRYWDFPDPKDNGYTLFAFPLSQTVPGSRALVFLKSFMEGIGMKDAQMVCEGSN